MDILMSLSAQGYSFDYSYKINHVSFGQDENFKIIRRRFSDQGFMDPLDGIQLSAERV
jgi:hypothetical protein